MHCSAAAAAIPLPEETSLARQASLPGQGMTLNEWGSLEQSELDIARTRYLTWARALATQLQARAKYLGDNNSTAMSEGDLLHPTGLVERSVLDVNGLQGCIFVGHTNTDMDSVATAIAAAYLYDGIAARAERDINGEIQFALRYSDYATFAGELQEKIASEHQGTIGMPRFFSDIPGAGSETDECGICLVDVNEPAQMVRELAAAFADTDDQHKRQKAAAMRNRIRGVIDHHALSQAMSTNAPIFMDIRPWGSAASIIAHHFIRAGKAFPVTVARLLLCGILSDTVNLTSPTATAADRMLCTLLLFFAKEEHPNELAKQMFKAKTAWLVSLPAFAMVRADQKNFIFDGHRLGWATLELNTPDKVLERAEEVIAELRLLKQDKQLDFAFLSVVDLVRGCTVLLIPGVAELELARRAFGKEASQAVNPAQTRSPALWQALKIHVCANAGDRPQPAELKADNCIYSFTTTKMNIGNVMSRKKEFIPPCAEVLTSGWQLSAEAKAELASELVPGVTSKHICSLTRGCSLERTYSTETGPLTPRYV